MATSALRVLFVLILTLIQEPLLDCADIIRPFAGDYYLGDGGAPTNASLFDPMHVAVDSVNNLVYIADMTNQIVRVVNQTSNTISTVAGMHSINGFSGDGKHELLTQ
jgi:DNA-binding beta-propeller fold protein YncE